MKDPPPQDDAVRKTVTVLFCDVVGSTSFAEQVDAETAREVMARYHVAAREAIEAHGGTLAKFIGDGVMATFGLPEVAIDDADRAVRAGLELQRHFAPVRDDVTQRHGVRLDLRVGINTGEVATGVDDDDLVGDALNTAARLEAACPVGEVLVGHATWRLTRSSVSYEPGGEIELKGKAAPVATYRVLGTESPTVWATPFVSRGPELAVLEDALGQAEAGQTAVMVTVIGSPGVGKTRLAAELVTRHEGRVGSFDLRCEPTGAATLEPVADLLRAAAGITDVQSEDEVRSGIAALLGETTPDVGRLTTLLASFVGAAPAPSTEEAFFAVRRLCERLAAGRPLVLVIDDIQWAEPRLLDLIEHLGEWVQAPVLIVNLARPELRDVRPALTEASRRLTAIVALDGLDASATQQLAARLLGADALPGELADRLGPSTEGNPLFVRELVRMLVDDGVLARTDVGWELAVDLDAVEVPPTVQSLLATRVERLPADERRLLELASVVGSEFALGAVADLAGSIGSVAATIEALRRKDIVESTGTYRGDEPLLRFHHVLIRDAAYRRLLKKTRARLHQQVGEWTQRTAAELSGDHHAAIAHHLEQAHRYRMELGLDDQETATLGRRAAGLLRAAADQALERDDLPGTGGFALRALDLIGPESPERDELLVLACEALLSAGDVARAEGPLAELSKADDLRTAAWAACFRGQLVTLTDPSALSEAEGAVGGAATQLESLGDAAGVAKAHQVRASILARLGRVAACEAELDRSLAAAREANDRRRISAVLGAAPTAALWGPSPVAQAGGRCLDVVRLVRITNGSPSVEATSWRCQAVLEALRGRFETARRLVRDSRRTSEELGLHHGLMETELYAGIIEMLAGAPEAAEPHLRAANEGLGRLGIGADLGQATAHLARSLLLQGRVAEAEERAAQATALAGQNPQTAVVAQCVTSEVLAALGRFPEAAAIAGSAVESLTGFDIVVDQANAHATLARVRAAAGDSTGAQAAAAEADRLYRLKGASVAATPLATPVGTATPPVPPARTSETRTSLTGVPTNRAFRVLESVIAAVNARDVEAVLELGADPLVLEEHRHSVVSHPADVEWTTLIRSMVPEPTGPVGVWTATLLAVRDEGWCLVHLGLDFDGLVVEFLHVNGVDESGHITHAATFDADDIAGAEARLDEWWLAEQAAPIQTLFRCIHELRRAQDRVDTAHMAELLDPAFAIEDHRALTGVGFGDMDKDRTIELLPVRNVAGQHSLITEVSRLTPTAICFAALTVQAHEGSTVEFPVWWVVVFGDDQRAIISEIFDGTAPDAALARFDDLTASPSVDPVRRNRVVQVAERFAAALTAQDLDTALALGAEHVLVVDRRHLMSNPPDLGWEGLIRSMVSQDPDSQVGRWAATPVAVRGERWCLVRARFSVEGNLVEWLSVIGVDDADHVTHLASFDDDELDDAQAHLNQLWLAGEDRACRAAFHAGDAARRAFASGDQEQIAAVLAPDLVYVDHRPLVGVGAMDRDDALARPVLFVEMARSLVVDVERLSGAGMVGSIFQRSLEEFAAEYRFRVLALTRDGMVHRLEVFDPDDDIVLTRFDELTAADGATGGSIRPNAASRLVEAFYAALEAGDLAAASALCTSDLVYREEYGFSTGASWDQTLRSMLEVPFAGATWTAALIATRGDRWSLHRVEVNADGFAMPMFTAVGVQVDGQLATHCAIFRVDALEQAQALMDEWWLADREPEVHLTYDLVLQATRAMDRRDLGRMANLLAEDLHMEDHRRLIGGEPLDRAGVLTSVSTAITDATLIADVVRLTDRGLACRSTAFYREAGLDAEADQAWTVIVRDGVVQHVELFDGVDLDEAATRFDELTTTPGEVPANLATLAVERMAAAVAASDLDDLVANFHPDVEASDRRHLAQTSRRGIADTTEGLRSMMDTGVASIDNTALAVRGEQLALLRWDVHFEQGYLLEVLHVGQVDRAGLIRRNAIFDLEDLAQAHDLLDAWFNESEEDSSPK